MTTTTDIKLFTSAMPNAPQLSGTAGSLVAILDACLVNGWGLKTVDSLVVSGGIATATIASGHSAAANNVVLIAGATPGGLNGERRVISTTTTTVVFDANGISDQTATGTITLKLAPAGWEKLYAGTNKAAYRSLAADSTKCVLRVDDTNTAYARVRGFENMTDVDTGTGPFPLDTQMSGGGWWSKANSTSGTRAWVIVAGSKGFYVLTAYYAPWQNNFEPNYFGDFASARSGDAFNCVLIAQSGDRSASSSVGVVGDALLYPYPSSLNAFIARPYAQVGGSQAARTRWPCLGPSGNNYSSGVSSFPTGPNPIDNGLYIVPLVVTESDQIRGALNGLFCIPQYWGVSYPSGTIFTAIEGYPGRMFAVFGAGNSDAANRFVVDVTGPWW